LAFQFGDLMQKMTFILARFSKNYSPWKKVEKGGEWNLGKESANPNREVELGAGTPIKFTKPEPFSFAL
jgi:hypothetical protein